MSVHTPQSALEAAQSAQFFSVRLLFSMPAFEHCADQHQQRQEKQGEREAAGVAAHAPADALGERDEQLRQQAEEMEKGIPRSACGSGKGSTLAHLATPLDAPSDAQKRSLEILRTAGKVQMQGARRQSHHNSPRSGPTISPRSSAPGRDDENRLSAKNCDGKQQGEHERNQETKQLKSQVPQVPDDVGLNAMQYTDLVILASQCGLRVPGLSDAASVRKALQRERVRKALQLHRAKQLPSTKANLTHEYDEC
eukprot:gene10971-biopygen3821